MSRFILAFAALLIADPVGGDGKERINKDIWHNGSHDLIAGRDGGDKEKPVRESSLALGPHRTIYLAWTTGDDDAADIHLTQSNDGGINFGKPKIIALGKNYSDAPKLAVDRNGTLHLAYAESSGGPFEQYRIRYMRSSNQGKTFEASRDIPMLHSDTGAAFPALALDGQGRLA